MKQFLERECGKVLIACEGNEGGGKTLQLERLRQYLLTQGYSVYQTREPGGTSLGDKVRSILLNTPDMPICEISEVLLFYAARAQLINERIKPALEEGKIVITDRSYYSSWAYQGYARGLDLEHLKQLTNIAVGCYRPDIVIWLDIDPKIGLPRKRLQEEWNRLDQETLEFHQRVREGYKCIASEEPERWIHIDASRSIDDVTGQILEAIAKRLK